MSVPPAPGYDAAEARARSRYMALNAVRIGGIAGAIIGIAGTRSALPIELPYIFSVMLALGGILAFFFAPPLMVKRWKQRDRQE